MIDYYEALREMHQGNVVKYVGTVNGNVMSDNGASFCMEGSKRKKEGYNCEKLYISLNDLKEHINVKTKNF